MKKIILSLFAALFISLSINSNAKDKDINVNLSIFASRNRPYYYYHPSPVVPYCPTGNLVLVNQPVYIPGDTYIITQYRPEFNHFYSVNVHTSGRYVNNYSYQWRHYRSSGIVFSPYTRYNDNITCYSVR